MQKLYFIFFVLIAFSSCRPRTEVLEIELPPTPVLSVQASWGVVTAGHLRLRENPDVNSKALITMWKSNVFEIITRKSVKDIVEEKQDNWYQISYNGLNGWVFGAYIDIYSGKNEALNASARLKVE
jgi:uncharacterized protein YgiM (DUF1202 family)